MNHLTIGFFLSVAFLFFSCNNNKLVISSADTPAACAKKGGYWYKDKCWAEFDDNGISKTDIDRVVDKEMIIIDSSLIYMNGMAYPVQMFMPEFDEDQIIFITIFIDDEAARTIITEAPAKKVENDKAILAEAIMLKGDIMQMNDEEIQASFEQALKGPMNITLNNVEELDILFAGTLQNGTQTESYEMSMRGSEALSGAGNSIMEVKGTEVHINGDLGTRSYQQLRAILAEHPEVKTAVLGNISGSVNDAVNMHTGRLLHEAGLNTKVLADSEIASGGVDLFCAGIERIVEKGAKIGIHSWCCLDNLTAAEIPQDHPAHKYQLAYFTMCLGPDLGPDLYFHTLTAAPFDGIHWMSDEDIVKWKVATRIID